MVNKYRILTFSNNLHIVQKRFFIFWLSDSEQFSSMADAKAFVQNLKLLAEKPKLLDVSYVD